MQGTQYATKRSILCRGAFCGPTMLSAIFLTFIKRYLVLKVESGRCTQGLLYVKLI